MVKQSTAQRNTPETRAIINHIYCSDKKDPLIKSDGRLMAKMELTWTDKEKDMEVITEFNFFNTIIEAQTYKASDPFNKQIVSLDYKP